MKEPKTETLSIRVTKRFKEALRAAADRENRSQANMLDVLLSDYCARNGIEIADESNLNSATEQLGGEKNMKKDTGTRND